MLAWMHQHFPPSEQCATKLLMYITCLICIANSIMSFTLGEIALRSKDDHHAYAHICKCGSCGQMDSGIAQCY